MRLTERPLIRSLRQRRGPVKRAGATLSKQDNATGGELLPIDQEPSQIEPSWQRPPRLIPRVPDPCAGARRRRPALQHAHQTARGIVEAELHAQRGGLKREGPCDRSSPGIRRELQVLPEAQVIDGGRRNVIVPLQRKSCSTVPRGAWPTRSRLRSPGNAR